VERVARILVRRAWEGDGYNAEALKLIEDAGWAEYVETAGEVIAALPAAGAAMREALEHFVGYGCPVCSGDCSSANPPVSLCPMQQARAALASAPARDGFVLDREQVDLVAWLCIVGAGELTRDDPKRERIRDLYAAVWAVINARPSPPSPQEAP
jgi:hypothetical protein